MQMLRRGLVLDLSVAFGMWKQNGSEVTETVLAVEGLTESGRAEESG